MLTVSFVKGGNAAATLRRQMEIFMIRRKSLWLDANQGDTTHGKAFGFIGTNDTDNYQGWFFTWPSDRAIITTVAERDAMLESLDADGINQNEPQIPHRWARQKLEKYLRKNFDLRTKA